MARAHYVGELAQGAQVDGVYVLSSKELRVARTGDAYLALTLADRTGSIPAVLFRPSRAAIEIPAGSPVSVKGTVTSFRSVRRVSVEQLQPAAAWSPDDLISSGSRPSEELVAEFTALVRRVKDRRLRGLLREVFGDKEFFARFTDCPASRSGGHRDYLGGLLEHTVMVAGLCGEYGRLYDILDTDMLLTAALLHDIGAVDGLRFDATIEPTDQGRLLGNASLSTLRVHAAGLRIDLDRDVLTRLEHCVMQQGDRATASDAALTIEAVALQHADRCDIGLSGFAHALSGALRAEASWTDGRNSFERELYVGQMTSCGEERADDGRSHERLLA